MSQPKIELLGIYLLNVNDTLIEEQMSTLYDIEALSEDTFALQQCRKECEDLLRTAVLIEVLASGIDKSFSIDDFTQERADLPRENWQAPWAEAFLAENGESLLVERGSDPPKGIDPFRIAFYLFDWKYDLPLKTSYGSIPCPKPTILIERLNRLVPYELLD
ncbi:MAG: hypothetical protein IPH75_00470 [bacterium]|nr:hypothetical protein [bacterium]